MAVAVTGTDTCPVEQTGVADFLRSRRARLQPEDVGLPRGSRRRTSGLRREEVAALVGMSSDYYARLERGNSPRPSEPMAAALARGLRLSLAERDYLFRLIGYDAPVRALRSEHVDVGLMRVMDQLQDTPAAIVTSLGVTLVQTHLGTSLLGDQTRYDGMARSVIYRWFTDPEERRIYPADEHPMHSRVLASQLRHVLAREGSSSPAAAMVETLHHVSPLFADVWAEHAVGLRYSEQKRLIHPRLGELQLHCQSLLDPEQEQSLLVFTAVPGSESYDKLRLLAVIGTQTLDA